MQIGQALAECDEYELSKQYPDTLFITLIQNGITVIMPLQDAIEQMVQQALSRKVCKCAE